jgi:hypothetical protein
MNFINEKYLKYLPSKKFVIITSASLGLAVIIFVIFFMSSKGESFITGDKKNNTALKIENQTLAELIQNDSDDDGIPNWEEALWGTDPNKKITFNDMPDATYIENKKKELKIEENTSVEEQKLTETEKFAREFFTSYTAMKSSGQVDSDTINSFSNALGQKIIDPNLIDRYSETDIKINSTDDSITKQKYYENMKKLFQSYQADGLGDELSIISNNLTLNSANGATDNTAQNNKLSTIASAYQDFAQKTMEMSAPQSLAQYHLRIANSSNNTGISVSGMTKMTDDPIVGLLGLSQYQKYSEELIKAVADLETALSE